MARTKEQVSEYNRRYRLAHREQLIAKKKEWNEVNRERASTYNKQPHVVAKRLASTQQWRDEQPKRIRLTVTPEQKLEGARRRSATWYKKHKGLHLQRVKSWKLRNHGKASINRRMQKVRRRALKVGAQINQFTKHEWIRMQGDYDYRCAYCWLRQPLTQDHIVPLSKGGNHHASNIVPACKPCNSIKGDKMNFMPAEA